MEDSKVPLILGRPFLHTADAVIRVKKKQLNLGVRTERMIFHINSTRKHSYSNDDTCFSIDVIDEILEEDFDALLYEEGIMLGHKISEAGLEVDKAKIDVISKLPPPTNIKGERKVMVNSANRGFGLGGKIGKMYSVLISQGKGLG
ncbi:hypothetical protein Tco_0847353 [Tanacetum coccineum]